jgi:hypothetical protein
MRTNIYRNVSDESDIFVVEISERNQVRISVVSLYIVHLVIRRARFFYYACHTLTFASPYGNHDAIFDENSHNEHSPIF